jgi:hypothetical protein
MKLGVRFGAVPRAVLMAVGGSFLALSVSSATVAAPAGKSVAFTRVFSLGVGTFPIYGMARSADGTLHLIYQTTTGTSAEPTGLGTTSISAAGKVGAEAAALTGWSTSIPGLVRLPNGNLAAVFGAISPPNPKQVSGLWAITSTNGGSTWSQPSEVGTQNTAEAHAYGANVTGQLAGPTPVFTLSVAGGIVAQKGLGQTSPTASLTDSSNGAAGDVDSALDGATSEAVASWQSLAGQGGDFIRGAAPALQSPTRIPGNTKNEAVISGRDKGSGVFAAYTTDNSHVRLIRYGGGSIAVGSLTGVTPKAIGTATGLDGRIWVMWGDENGGIAITRSNKAVTKFEPIQQVNPHAFSLYRVGGDGRLGPLDLLVEMIPEANNKTLPPGTFHARVLPELTGTPSAVTITQNGKTTGYKLTVTVTDAGDAVSGATVQVDGKSAKTASNGVAKLTLPASAPGTATVTVTAPTYQPLIFSTKL